MSSSYPEYRVHYHYGINSGTLIGRDVEAMVERQQAVTHGTIIVDKVEVRMVTVSEWEPVEKTSG